MIFSAFTHLCDDTKVHARYDGIMLELPADSYSVHDECVSYEIIILGTLDERWAGWFNGCDVVKHHSGKYPHLTKITCRALDQAGLRGMLNKIWDLNLYLISVQHMPAYASEVTSPEGR